MKDIINSLKWRYAVKKFDVQQQLPDDKIHKLKEAFNLTATSYGLQPVTLLVIRNKALQENLVPHSFDQQQVGQASHVLVICIQKKVDETYISRYFNQVGKVRGTSETVLNPFKEALVDSFSQKKEEEVQHWATNQGYLAMGNLLTVCAIEKIDSCPMEGFDAKAYDRILKLEEKGLTSVLVLPVGYRAEDDTFAGFKKVRKNMKESIIEIV